LGFSCLFLFLSVESYRGSCKIGGFSSSSSSSSLKQVLSYERFEGESYFWLGGVG
jgi:hypothetical protein